MKLSRKTEAQEANVYTTRVFLCDEESEVSGGSLNGKDTRSKGLKKSTETALRRATTSNKKRGEGEGKEGG
jgi:hypothetical protein